MGAVTNAKQAFAVPFSQTVDLDGEEFDLCPIIQLRDSIFQERSEADDVAMQSGQAAPLDCIELAFWDNKTDLEIIASVEENKQLPVAKIQAIVGDRFPVWKGASKGRRSARRIPRSRIFLACA